MRDRSMSRTVYRGSAAQAKFALNHHCTKAEGGNQKAPSNQEQIDCRSTAGTNTDLQVGRDAPHVEDRHRAPGSSSSIYVQGNIRCLIRRELDAEPRGSSR
jgi:hypothetical protein